MGGKIVLAEVHVDVLGLFFLKRLCRNPGVLVLELEGSQIGVLEVVEVVL